MLQLLLLVSVIQGGQILEHPEDVTVLQGEPATLKCRVSEGDAVWYKDGLKISNKRNVVILPDGSLFFLTTRNTDTGLYHCESQDGAGSYPAALIVGTAEEGIIPTVVEEEEFEEDPDISIEIQDIPAETEAVPLEVVTSKDVPNSVIIISMVVVAILTIIIIVGAALIFNKIKKVNSNISTNSDHESTAPMMYAVPRTLDTTDRGVNIIKYPHNHYNYILHNEYDTPIPFTSSDIYKCVTNSLEKTSPTNSYHYASSNIIHNNSNSRQSTTKYSRKASHGSPKDNFHYFST